MLLNIYRSTFQLYCPGAPPEAYYTFYRVEQLIHVWYAPRKGIIGTSEPDYITVETPNGYLGDTNDGGVSFYMQYDKTYSEHTAKQVYDLACNGEMGFSLKLLRSE